MRRRNSPWLLNSVTIVVAGALLHCLAASADAQVRDPFRDARFRMVDQDLASEGITNERVLAAMKETPRHLFVRPNLRHLAYLDQALDIGFKQTISPPFIVAYMTQVLDPQPEDRVLEIGTGSGYQSAVLSGLVKEVYSIEILPTLGRNAEKLLGSLGYKNVHVQVGDGYEGWPEHAPFDKIIVTCSPESIPQPLVDQLKDGGRMIIPLGERYQQVFHLLEKKDGQMVETKLLPTLFVPMTGKSEDVRAVKPDPLNPRIVNGGFEELRDDGLAVGWHYQRRSTIEREGAPEGGNYICFENTDPGRTAHILQATAIDGLEVPAMTVSLSIKVGNVLQGPAAFEKPALIVHFFDQRRVPIGEHVIGPWLAESETWQKISSRIAVPPAAREAILQVGLNGATGKLCIDNVQLTTQRR